MNAVILKYKDGERNYWGNANRPDGVSIQTLHSITQTVVNVAAAGGHIYLYRAFAGQRGIYGPMVCEPEIIHESGCFDRLALTGNIRNTQAFLDAAVTSRVLRTLQGPSEGVLIVGKRVEALYFGAQPPGLSLPPPFFQVEGVGREERVQAPQAVPPAIRRREPPA